MDEVRIYKQFDPAPLTPGDNELYVDLDNVRGETHIVKKFARRIRLSRNSNTVQILAGHRGSGKSTELRRLQENLQSENPRYFVVYVEADEDIEGNDVDFPEVLIAIVRQMADQLRKRAKIELKPGYFKDRAYRLKGLLGSEVDFEKVDLGTGLLKISAAIKNSPDARLEVRRLLEPDTSNWLEAANEVIGQAVTELRRQGFEGLVIIVDDLDKMILKPHAAGCTTAEYLFIHREAQLRAFNSHMVYTMPIALAYSTQEQNIENLYGGRVPVVPMVKIMTRPPDQTRYEDGFEKFRDLVRRRLSRAGVKAEQVFDSKDTLDQLIELSAGQPRELVILIREAIVSSDLPICKEAVERAEREGRWAFERQLNGDHWPVIDEVRLKGEFSRTNDNDAAIRDLLDSRALLQYVNADEWYDVNPMVPKKRP
ncbi:MAG TPA: hypothetical protein VGL56_17300 [Fimbriimonadaceae bacterium]|jgi:hypothetical protein